MAATDVDPVALEQFELVPEPVPGEVLGADPGEIEVWALRISGAPVRELLTDPVNAVRTDYVFAAPLDVIGNLGRTLTELYERQRSTTP